MKTALKVEQLHKTYGVARTKVTAVNDVSFVAKSGQVSLIMGPSGSGKTTLLLMLGTLLRPTSGSLTLGDKELHRFSPASLATWRLEHIGFVFQQFNLLPALNAQENIMVPLLAAGQSKKAAAARALNLLEELNLAKRAHSLPSQLSGGEQQRVAIARALANDPALILADEPTANLDSKSGHEVVQLLAKIAHQDGRTVIIVSHDDRIKSVADQVLLMEDGSLKRAH